MSGMDYKLGFAAVVPISPELRTETRLFKFQSTNQWVAGQNMNTAHVHIQERAQVYPKLMKFETGLLSPSIWGFSILYSKWLEYILRILEKFRDEGIGCRISMSFRYIFRIYHDRMETLCWCCGGQEDLESIEDEGLTGAEARKKRKWLGREMSEDPGAGNCWGSKVSPK